MKARLISNVTLDPITRHFVSLEVNCAPFDRYSYELTCTQTASSVSDYQVLLSILEPRVLFGDSLYTGAAPSRWFEYLKALEQFCRAHPSKLVVANTICLPALRYLNYSDVVSSSSLRARELEANQALCALSNQYSNLIVVDLEPLFRKFGEDRLLAPALWYLARIPFSECMFRELAKSIEQAIAAYLNQSRKVLVLDLDNTLWGGIVGEDGPRGVVLSEDGRGRCYRDFQRLIKATKQTGVILAICSKNNWEDVKEIFERNDMMILNLADFSAIEINWDSKPQNLVKIAGDLNLGLDSFVFIDDNPVERASVTSALPDIFVPDFPSKVEALPTWFLENIVYPHFARYRITDEDLHKAEQYAANRTRNQVATNLNPADFLRSLNIRLRFEVDPLDRVSRAAQMTQKTNQLNVTTRRYSEADIRRFMESRNHSVVLLDYEDRFGKEGIVGLAILDYAKGEIDSLLFSCRVIGRGVEAQLLTEVESLFRSRGLSKIGATFISTSKNAPAKKLFSENNFTLVSASGHGTEIYQKELK